MTVDMRDVIFVGAELVLENNSVVLENIGFAIHAFSFPSRRLSDWPNNSAERSLMSPRYVVTKRSRSHEPHATKDRDRGRG